MIRLVHCELSEAHGPCVGGVYPVTEETIIHDAYRGIDTQDDLIPAFKITPLHRTNWNFETININYSIFARLEAEAIRVSGNDNSTIRHCTFYKCETNFDFSDIRKTWGNPGYSTITTTHQIENCLDHQSAYLLKQNWVLANIIYTLYNGGIEGSTVTDITDSTLSNIGPSVFPLFWVESDLNLRLIWAGTDPLGIGYYALIDSPGAFDASDTTDMGAYHQMLDDIIVDVVDATHESPAVTEDSLRALQGSNGEGLISMNGFALDHFWVFKLNFGALDYAHARTHAYHFMNTIRRLRAPFEFFPSPRKLLSDQTECLSFEAEFPGEFDYMFEAWDHLFGAGVLTFQPAELLPNEIEFTGYFDNANIDINKLKIEWIDAVYLILIPGNLHFDYNNGGGFTPSEALNTTIITGSIDPDNKTILTPTQTHWPLINGNTYESALIRANWVGYFTIVISTDGIWTVTLLDNEGNALPQPFQYDKWLLTIPNTQDIINALGYIEALGDSTFTSGVVQITEWDTDHYLSPAKLLLKGNADGTYQATLVGAINPLVWLDSDPYIAIKTQLIEESYFFGHISSTFVVPDYQGELSRTHQNAGQIDTWHDNGMEWHANHRTRKRAPQLSSGGFEQSLIQVMPDRKQLPFEGQNHAEYNVSLELLYASDPGLPSQFQISDHIPTEIGITSAFALRLALGAPPAPFTFDIADTILPLANTTPLVGGAAALTLIRNFILTTERWNAALIPNFEGSGRQIIAIYVDSLKAQGAPRSTPALNTGDRLRLGTQFARFEYLPFHQDMDYSEKNWAQCINDWMYFGMSRNKTEVEAADRTKYTTREVVSGNNFKFNKVLQRWEPS